MLELLSQKRKKDVRGLYFRRYLNMVLVALILVLIMMLISLYPSFYALSQKEKILNDQKNAINQDGVDELNNDQELKEKITKIDVNLKRTNQILKTIADIKEKYGTDISINDFQFINDSQNPSINIKGTASIRSQAVSFTEDLKKIENFEQVILPISNLVKDKDLNFSIEIKIKNI